MGTFLLKFALENMVGCEFCGSQHIYRYYIDQFCVTISNEFIHQTSKLFLSNNLEEDAELKSVILS